MYNENQLENLEINQLKKIKEKVEESVGYCKPPKSGQFKKGVSGNPTGRKKKVIPKSMYEALQLGLTNKIKIVNESGKNEEVYIFEVIVKQIISDALKNDGRSRKMLLEAIMKLDLLNNRKLLEDHMVKDEQDREADRQTREFLISKLDSLIKEQEAEEEQ